MHLRKSGIENNYVLEVWNITTIFSSYLTVQAALHELNQCD